MISLFFEKLSLNDCFNTGCCNLKFRNLALRLTDVKRGKKKAYFSSWEAVYNLILGERKENDYPVYIH